MISLGYQFIDQWWWRLTTLKMHLYGGDWNFCEYEGSTSELSPANAAEGKSCEGLQASFKALSLIAQIVWLNAALLAAAPVRISRRHSSVGP